MRALQEDQQWLINKNGYLLQVLQRGPVRPSSPNPCTFISGRGHGKCTLNEMDVAGEVVHAPPSYPDSVTN
ncbi:Threonylcarbamoyl-AMP synthase [Quillaja saponaria]|uniref:Threonylcarbamoyl-AMP synthase n=1 Tax=Quillaja saponaria TaxID=32244 RepID=A0AAD7Q0V4_QUISA|nr:Threonylcarbamoyl-AMP synthase [Quillaja saponaria]